VVKSIEHIGCPFHLIFGLGNMGIAGKEDLSLNSREGFGDNGDRCRFLVFAHDSRKGLILLLLLLLAYASIEVFSPSGVFSRVSPDIQGFLWAWGCRWSDTWGGWWGGRGSIIGWLAMWFVVGYIGELLVHFLEFCGDAR
jgi:hypothetical protein